MIIKFFEKNGAMDPNACKSGVYKVSLINSKTKESICLYIGESEWIAARCGTHLYSLEQDSRLFGLSKDDMDNDNLILEFAVEKSMDKRKSLLGVGEYKKAELEAIKNNEPLTQFITSDRQLNVDKKFNKVQKEIAKWK